jgi:hypothetical protein
VNIPGFALHAVAQLPLQLALQSAIAVPLQVPAQLVSSCPSQSTLKSPAVQVAMQSAPPWNSQPPDSCIVSAIAGAAKKREAASDAIVAAMKDRERFM